MYDAPGRVPPETRPPPPWLRRLSCVNLLLVLLPFFLCAFVCVEPVFGVLIFLSCTCLACCVVTPAMWRAYFAMPENLPVAAMLLVAPILQVILTHHALLLLPALTSAPLTTAATVVAEVTVYAAYAHLLRHDGGFVPGGQAADAEAYWDTIEREGQLPSEDAFDFRAEALRPPRAKFSPMAGGLIRCMDHDCPWIGGPVGSGNHVAFVTLLLAGDAALLLHTTTACLVRPLGVASDDWHQPLQRLLVLVRLLTLQPPPENDSAATAAMGVTAIQEELVSQILGRLVVLSEVLALLLVVLITCLLVSQLRLIAINVLAVEELRWVRLHAGKRPPRRGTTQWNEYAPHDRGLRRNVRDFLQGARQSSGAYEGCAEGEALKVRVQ